MIVNAFKLLKVAFFSCSLLMCFTSVAIANTEISCSDDIFEDNEIAETECDSCTQNESVKIIRSAKAQVNYDQIRAVLDREEFGKIECKKEWRKIDLNEENKDKFPEWIIKILEWFESREPSDKKDSDFSFSGFASIVEFLFWALAIGLIVFVLIKYNKQIQSLAKGLVGRKQNAESLPTTMFGLDIKKESLPDDIIGTAKKHWNNGDMRQAIAILLRASLIKLLNEHECRFYDSDTEAECCLRIEKQAPKPLSQYMRNLVSVWQQVAYAHRMPSQDKFDSLCKQWQETF